MGNTFGTASEPPASAAPQEGSVDEALDAAVQTLPRRPERGILKAPSPPQVPPRQQQAQPQPPCEDFAQLAAKQRAVQDEEADFYRPSEAASAEVIPLVLASPGSRRREAAKRMGVVEADCEPQLWTADGEAKKRGAGVESACREGHEELEEFGSPVGSLESDDPLQLLEDLHGEETRSEHSRFSSLSRDAPGSDSGSGSELDHDLFEEIYRAAGAGDARDAALDRALTDMLRPGLSVQPGRVDGPHSRHSLVFQFDPLPAGTARPAASPPLDTSTPQLDVSGETVTAPGAGRPGSPAAAGHTGPDIARGGSAALEAASAAELYRNSRAGHTACPGGGADMGSVDLSRVPETTSAADRPVQPRDIVTSSQRAKEKSPFYDNVEYSVDKTDCAVPSAAGQPPTALQLPGTTIAPLAADEADWACLRERQVALAMALASQTDDEEETVQSPESSLRLSAYSEDSARTEDLFSDDARAVSLERDGQSMLESDRGRSPSEESLRLSLVSDMTVDTSDWEECAARPERLRGSCESAGSDPPFERHLEADATPRLRRRTEVLARAEVHMLDPAPGRPPLPPGRRHSPPPGGASRRTEAKEAAVWDSGESLDSGCPLDRWLESSPAASQEASLDSGFSGSPRSPPVDDVKSHQDGQDGGTILDSFRISEKGKCESFADDEEGKNHHGFKDTDSSQDGSGVKGADDLTGKGDGSKSESIKSSEAVTVTDELSARSARASDTGDIGDRLSDTGEGEFTADRAELDLPSRAPNAALTQTTDTTVPAGLAGTASLDLTERATRVEAKQQASVSSEETANCDDKVSQTALSSKIRREQFRISANDDIAQLSTKSNAPTQCKVSPETSTQYHKEIEEVIEERPLKTMTDPRTGPGSAPRTLVMLLPGQEQTYLETIAEESRSNSVDSSSRCDTNSDRSQDTAAPGERDSPQQVQWDLEEQSFEFLPSASVAEDRIWETLRHLSGEPTEGSGAPVPPLPETLDIESRPEYEADETLTGTGKEESVKDAVSPYSENKAVKKQGRDQSERQVAKNDAQQEPLFETKKKKLTERSGTCQVIETAKPRSGKIELIDTVIITSPYLSRKKKDVKSQPKLVINSQSRTEQPKTDKSKCSPTVERWKLCEATSRQLEEYLAEVDSELLKDGSLSPETPIKSLDELINGSLGGEQDLRALEDEFDAAFRRMSRQSSADHPSSTISGEAHRLSSSSGAVTVANDPSLISNPSVADSGRVGNSGASERASRADGVCQPAACQKSHGQTSLRVTGQPAVAAETAPRLRTRDARDNFPARGENPGTSASDSGGDSAARPSRDSDGFSEVSATLRQMEEDLIEQLMRMGDRDVSELSVGEKRHLFESSFGGVDSEVKRPGPEWIGRTDLGAIRQVFSDARSEAAAQQSSEAAHSGETRDPMEINPDEPYDETLFENRGARSTKAMDVIDGIIHRLNDITRPKDAGYKKDPNFDLKPVPCANIASSNFEAREVIETVTSTKPLQHPAQDKNNPDNNDSRSFDVNVYQNRDKIQQSLHGYDVSMPKNERSDRQKTSIDILQSGDDIPAISPSCDTAVSEYDANVFPERDVIVSPSFDVTMSGDEKLTETEEDSTVCFQPPVAGLSETEDEWTLLEMQGGATTTPELPEVVFIDSDHCEAQEGGRERLATPAEGELPERAMSSSPADVDDTEQENSDTLSRLADSGVSECLRADTSGSADSAVILSRLPRPLVPSRHEHDLVYQLSDGGDSGDDRPSIPARCHIVGTGDTDPCQSHVSNFTDDEGQREERCQAEGAERALIPVRRSHSSGGRLALLVRGFEQGPLGDSEEALGSVQEEDQRGRRRHSSAGEWLAAQRKAMEIEQGHVQNVKTFLSTVKSSSSSTTKTTKTLTSESNAMVPPEEGGEVSSGDHQSGTLFMKVRANTPQGGPAATSESRPGALLSTSTVSNVQVGGEKPELAPAASGMGDVSFSSGSDDPTKSAEEVMREIERNLAEVSAHADLPSAAGSGEGGQAVDQAREAGQAEPAVAPWRSQAGRKRHLSQSAATTGKPSETADAAAVSSAPTGPPEPPRRAQPPPPPPPVVAAPPPEVAAPPVPAPPPRQSSHGILRPRSNSVPGLAEPPELPELERPESVWDYSEGWRRPGRWSSAHSVRSEPDPEEYVDTLRYRHPSRVDSFLPPEGNLSYAPRMQCRRAEPPSGKTPIAEQIFSEYQEKLVERMDRKANGALRLNKPKRELPLEPHEMGIEQKVRQEFLGRAKERNERFGDNWDPREPEPEPERPSFRIQGTADGISEAIADDVKYLLQQDGVWHPGSSPKAEPSGGITVNDDPNQQEPERRTRLSPPTEPVWTPKALQSPTTQRKEFRPVQYDSDSLKRQKLQGQTLGPAPDPAESFAWRSPEPPTLTSAGENSHHQLDGLRQDMQQPAKRASKPQSSSSPLLQQSREPPQPRGAKYVPLNDPPPIARPNEKRHLLPKSVYAIKREYETQTDGGERRKFADLSHLPISGVGPRTHHGMPVSLKSAVKEEHQPEWYKLMYDSLHRAKPDCVRVVYKTKGRYNYPSGGYASEPETGHEPDCGRRTAFRPPDLPDSDFHVSSSQRRPLYRNQPGRIEDYLPGRSSLAEKEARERANRAAVSAAHPKSFTRAVLDGYDSDTPLVFRRRGNSEPLYPADPEQQRSLYSRVQRGGDIPAAGLRKPAQQKHSEPVIGAISKSMSTSFIPDRRISSPQRERRDYCDAAGSEEWRDQQSAASEDGQQRQLQLQQQQQQRRQADSLTPSQKSPIPLNRYDNLFDDVTFRSSRGGDAKMAARALHSFKPINNRELSFNKGDIIFIRRQVDRNWLEGELRGRIGIFPINYVQVVPLDGEAGQPQLGSGGQARARYTFTGQTPAELSFAKGDLVTVLRRVDHNWLEGRLGQRVGLFPASYVEMLGRPLAARVESSAAPECAGQLYRALYSYSPQHEDELRLTQGHLVHVMEQCEDGWFVGTAGHPPRLGTFPGNYVQRI